jgi:hypothetical protein
MTSTVCIGELPVLRELPQEGQAALPDSTDELHFGHRAIMTQPQA